MDLRASKCSPLVRSSDLGSNHSLPLKDRFRCDWRSSQLKDCAVQCCLRSYSRSKGSKAASGLSASFGTSQIEEISWKERPIRTLLIDNYDSYTYNLYQLLCVINQAPPRVIKNDEFSWEYLHKLLCEESAFDNIVISPGPGSPMCAKDIGVCLQVLQECVKIPILGVCLGHQALGYVNGARVVHAPEPVHGRLSEVEHTSCPLFKDIPSGKGSGFQVVRYHSLMLDTRSLPEDLVPTAWTLSSFPTPSLEDPLIEHGRAPLDGNLRIGSGKSNKTGLLANQDSRFHCGRPDIWVCEPTRLRTAVEIHIAPETGSTVHTNFGTLLAKEGNIPFGVDSCSSDNFSDHKSKSEVIMAISHRKRPHYGVQFHPESVATSFGRKILENFSDITKEYWKEKKAKDIAKTHASRQTVPKDLQCSGGSRSSPLRMYWEKVDGIANEAGGSEGIFCGLFGEGTAKDTFWLDSALQPGEARFSFMGGKGGRLWKRLTYSLCGKHGSGGVLRIENDTDVEELRLEKGFLNFLSSELESYTTSKVDSEGLPFDFWGGYVGYLGYELKAECGASFNQHKSKLPDACYFFVDQFIAVDHLTNDVYAVVLYTETPSGRDDIRVNGGNASDETYKIFNSTTSALVSSVLASDNPTIKTSNTLSAKVWVKEIMQRIRGLVEGGRDMAIERRYSSQLASSSLGSIKTATHFVIAKSRKQYMEDVKSCLKYIRDGESYELCLTTQLQKRVDSLDALGLYLTLRKMNPAPYAAWLNFGPEEVCVCCSSPERFLRLDQNGMIEAKPIKGTIPRGQSQAEDEALRAKLQYSEKDRAENLMIVDLLRNDLGRVCKPGSVHVPSLMAVESYATVHTMVSTVRGMKRQDVTTLDCVRASFPGGSMTGAPKLRSMELLDSLECSPRGVYSGSIGFFSVNSSFDLNIVIRTLVIHQGIAFLGAGGAIVSLSDPGDEYEEMLLKTKAPVRAVSQHEALTSLSSQEMESGPLPHVLLGLH
ncbi:hypothetical protein GOP47_0012111 [Adiantum capillus-veneris]|uniref:aminodeoxychorismate synthase n=1 Tax=Adiantum capillus-veneris TaxID=13818 RepID=A0A9D4UQE1_ADICA|nr:hypothetical protein GOP47_0012111 [Adiantum capillus-veneris]